MFLSTARSAWAGELRGVGVLRAAGTSAAANLSIRFNGTLSTALTNPLYPVGMTPGNGGTVGFITTQGYVVNYSMSDGRATGSLTTSYSGPGCTGNVYVSAGTFSRGMIYGFGPANTRVYVPKTGVAVIDPSRQSQLSSAGVCTTATVALSPGAYWEALPMNTAVTGYSESTVGQMTWEYVP